MMLGKGTKESQIKIDCLLEKCFAKTVVLRQLLFKKTSNSFAGAVKLALNRNSLPDQTKSSKKLQYSHQVNVFLTLIFQFRDLKMRSNKYRHQIDIYLTSQFG
jgi:hypothetical protein